MRARPALLSAIVLTALLGCAGYTPPLRVTEAPSPQDAYIYGRFFLDVPKFTLLTAGQHTLGLAGYHTMAFSFECGSGQQVVVKFRVKSPLQLLKIAPASKCIFREVVYVDPNGTVRKKNPPPDGWAKENEFLPGKAYYLGDFAAEVSGTVEPDPTYRNGRSNFVHRWAVKSIRDDYELSTDEMRKKYPLFATVPTEKTLLAK